MSSDLHIHQQGELPIDLPNTPWQNIKPLIFGLGQRARYKQAMQRREYLGTTPELDSEALVKALKQQPQQDLPILHHIMTGACWTQQHL